MQSAYKRTNFCFVVESIESFYRRTSYKYTWNNVNIHSHLCRMIHFWCWYANQKRQQWNKKACICHSRCVTSQQQKIMSHIHDLCVYFTKIQSPSCILAAFSDWVIFWWLENIDTLTRSTLWISIESDFSRLHFRYSIWLWGEGWECK